MKLYHYVHCPFCLRVRFSLGFLGLSYESIVLDYDDEKTPIELSGKKLLPIFQKQDGTVLTESLDICKYLFENQDQTNFFDYPSEELNSLLNKLGSNIHSLAMPYWAFSREFTNNARSYFKSKKEAKRGPFSELVQKRRSITANLEKDLIDLETYLIPMYQSQELSFQDILIASHLWGLYVVPEFQFSTKLHNYLQKIAHICHFDYHRDLWSSF